MIIEKPRGIALITVMLIVAFIAIIATQMTARLQLQIQRSANLAFNQQAYWYAMGAEDFAKRVLEEDFAKQAESTNLSQNWAKSETTYPVENGEISGKITDLQACFNLNSLRGVPEKANNRNQQKGVGNENADKEREQQGQIRQSGHAPDKKTIPQQAFERLLVKLNIEDVGAFEAEYMTDALIDWLDDNRVIISAGGAEDDDYAGKEFGYYAANHYLASVNELRLIEHFSVKTIEALKPYVCVLPQTNRLQLNVNTLDKEHAVILAAILDISKEDAEQLLDDRDEKGFDSVAAFFQQSSINKMKSKADVKQYFTIDSDYFKLTATTRFDNSFFTLNSIFKVTENQQLQVLQRTIGKD